MKIIMLRGFLLTFPHKPAQAYKNKLQTGCKDDFSCLVGHLEESFFF